MKAGDCVTWVARYGGLLLCAIVYAGVLSPTLGRSDDTPIEGGHSTTTPHRYRDRVFSAVDVREDIVFRSLANDNGTVENLRLDVYLPAGDATRSRAAILWIHGGGPFTTETRKQGYIVDLATEFAKRGYVSVAADYRFRLHPGLSWEGMLQEAVDDCRAALEWMRVHSHTYRIDPRRIAVGGGSAGGVVAVSVASTENTEAARTGEPGVFALIDLWGSPPLFFTLGEMNNHFPPTVIIHGTRDVALPFVLSELFAAKLKRVGVYHLLHPIPGAPHTPTEHMAEIVDTSAQFLYSLLTQRAEK